MNLPCSTYRLQFNAALTFQQATELLEYLDRLGITDVYASPVLAATPGSLHGYDVTDHSRWNPELGTEEDLLRMAAAVRDRGMGLIMDVVPNHMCIAGSRNPWWNEVLRDGPGSAYARYFDIDWEPPTAQLRGKVLCPVLGKPFGQTLEAGEIRLCYDEDAGPDLLQARYGELRLPLSPRSWQMILQPVLDHLSTQLRDDEAGLLELESILRALAALPPQESTAAQDVQVRQRERVVLQRRVRALFHDDPAARRALDAALQALNGRPGAARSFDGLEALLREQIYRLSYWRVAAEEINYRRFFDVNDLAAIRVEEPAVFLAVHRLLLSLCERRLLTGLRVDHVDGLYDPRRYLGSLQGVCRLKLGATAEPEEPAVYLVVEKILAAGETLPEGWPVHGTTGYDFLRRVQGVLLDPGNGAALRAIYRRFLRSEVRFADVAYDSKRLILQAALSSELHVLTCRLARIAEQHRSTRDLTFSNLHQAVSEVIACFPVYRSYIRFGPGGVKEVSAADRAAVETAVAAARARSPVLSGGLFDFVAAVLLEEDPAGLDDDQRAERQGFVVRFQQLTGPVMAKGVEDTAFYRFSMLAALCEVGGDPEALDQDPITAFHRDNQARRRSYPHSLLCTATHDTKRGEDVRARLSVLSEIPEAWEDAARRARHAAREHLRQWGDAAPGPQEEYLLYQTLLGTLPADPTAPLNQAAWRAYGERVTEYMLKAVKEAKLRTSWINPNQRYEDALRALLQVALDPGGPVLTELLRLSPQVLACGRYNTLTQVLCKLGAPGVPDFYQGTELVDLSLVDPDNRRPVDFGRRQALLAALDQEEAELGATALARRLLEEGDPDRLKLYVTSRGLRFRRQQRALLTHGDYLPVLADGARAQHVVAFARTDPTDAALFIAGRLYAGLGVPAQLPVGAAVWGDTALLVPAQLRGAYQDVLGGGQINLRAGQLALSQVLLHLPVALLRRVR